MTVETAIFTCSICGEPSAEICVYCTKDACANHRCDRCKRCSDCCECEMPLSAAEVPLATEVVPDIVQEVAPQADALSEPLEAEQESPEVHPPDYRIIL